MTNEDYSMSTPPMEGEFVSGERSSWPTVVGVFGIVLSSLGLLGGCCGIAWPFILPSYVKMLEGQQGVTPEQIQQIKDSVPSLAWAVGSSILGLSLAVLLLYSSIQLIKRRSRARSLMLTWTWIQIPWAVVAIAIQYAITPAPAQGGAAAGGQQVIMFASLGCGLIFSLAFPVFLAIWFSRERIRTEVASWDHQVYDPI